MLSEKWSGYDVFTASEAAEILRVSEWSVYEAVKRGEIPAIRIGKTVRIGRKTLETMIGNIAPFNQAA